MDIKYNFRIGEFDYGRTAAAFFRRTLRKNATQRVARFAAAGSARNTPIKTLDSVERFLRKSPHNYLI